jgi:hypothetical protein
MVWAQGNLLQNFFVLKENSFFKKRLLMGLFLWTIVLSWSCHVGVPHRIPDQEKGKFSPQKKRPKPPLVGCLEITPSPNLVTFF